jgi:hypothetical protein
MEGIEAPLGIIRNLVTIIGGLAVLVGGLWAYTKYVLERGLLPPTILYITCKKLGIVNNQNVIDIKLHLNNVWIVYFDRAGYSTRFTVHDS